MDKPTRYCKIDGCDRELIPPYGRGMCSLHYQRWRKHGDPMYVRDRRKWEAECSIDGCEKPTLARGWCSVHWTRWQRHGSPTARIRGEVVNGCRECPACGIDKTLSAFPEGRTGTCRDCDARRARIRRTFVPWECQSTSEFECRTCGETFSGNARNSTFCSRECFRADYGQRSQRRKQRLSEVERENFKRTEIFERDEWRCGICGDPIDPSISWPARMCGVIDHVIPVSRGGSDTRANVQAAHNRCNARKGARM